MHVQKVLIVMSSLPALNQEVQFDPNKFHLALDKKLCLAIKFSRKYQCHNNIFN